MAFCKQTSTSTTLSMLMVGKMSVSLYLQPMVIANTEKEAGNMMHPIHIP